MLISCVCHAGVTVRYLHQPVPVSGGLPQIQILYIKNYTKIIEHCQQNLAIPHVQKYSYFISRACFRALQTRSCL